MVAPRKFDEETRERAVRMYHDRLAAEGGSKLAAREHVGCFARHQPGNAAELDRTQHSDRDLARNHDGG